MKHFFTHKILFQLSILGCMLFSAPLNAQGLLPDLQTVIPLQLQIQNKQQREMLRFSNGIANTGHGDIRLRAQIPTTDESQPQLAIQEVLDADRNIVYEQVVSEFQFHPEHNHWHINDVALFEVHSGSPTGPVYGTVSVKVTFCLIDWYKLDSNSPTSERIYWDCNASYQGIQPGWCDQYHQATEGQELDITGAPPGLYYLVSTANPDHNFIEENYMNNTAWVSFMLTRTSQGNPKIQITGNSPCSSPALCGIGAPNR